MLITLEEAIKQGHTIVGMGPRPDFVISSRTDMGSNKNIWFSD